MNAALAESYRVCQKMAASSGSNFYYAFFALPHEMFREMCALYAFMRRTDDIGDAPGVDAEARRRQLDDWERQLAAALAGEPTTEPALRALADVAARKNLSAEWLHGVVAGVRRDLDAPTFPTFSELEDYCLHVAGYVGLCCVQVWGYSGPLPREDAIACGTAFQLTNILRDLGEDSGRGRVYLPREDLERFQYSESALAAGVRNSAYVELMRFEVERARDFYRRALPLLDVLSPAGRRIFSAFFAIYSSLLQQIEARGYDVFSQRIRAPRWKKLTIALQCLAGRECACRISPDR